MLASCSDDGPFARKYELSYGLSRSERLSGCLQGLHDLAEPLSWAAPMKLIANGHTHRIVTEGAGDERRWQAS